MRHQLPKDNLPQITFTSKTQIVNETRRLKQLWDKKPTKPFVDKNGVTKPHSSKYCIRAFIGSIIPYDDSRSNYANALYITEFAENLEILGMRQWDIFSAEMWPNLPFTVDLILHVIAGNQPISNLRKHLTYLELTPSNRSSYDVVFNILKPPIICI